MEWLKPSEANNQFEKIQSVFQISRSGNLPLIQISKKNIHY